MPNAVGRPTKYDPAMCEQVFKLCLLGATDEQIADFFGIAPSTLYLWADQHEAFSEARKNGKLAADANVAHALYHRALGYSHPAVKILAYEGHSWEHTYIEHYPPDTAAAFIWLKNRAGWKDKIEHEHSLLRRLASMPPAELRRVSEMSDEEIVALIGDGSTTPR